MNSGKSSNSKKPIKWNEENLRENEKIQEDILRNMKEKNQVIDEPKTPYRHADSDEELMDNEWDEFNERLQTALTKDDNVREWGESDDETSPSNLSPNSQKVKEEEFKRKRKNHYNEFQVMKRMQRKRKLQKLNQEEDEDDDDEDIKELLANPPKIIVKSK